MSCEVQSDRYRQWSYLEVMSFGGKSQGHSASVPERCRIEVAYLHSLRLRRSRFSEGRKHLFGQVLNLSVPRVEDRDVAQTRTRFPIPQAISDLRARTRQIET